MSVMEFDSTGNRGGISKYMTVVELIGTVD